MKSFLKFLLFLFLLAFLYPVTSFAKENDQFITIVNPVRNSYYTKDLVKNLQAQYEIISQNNLPATWLLTYDVLANPKAISFLKSVDKKQELGIFLEITPGFAEIAGVKYNESGSWHHANSVFLSGYIQKERIKLIDTVFEKFKNRFGYYPVSVGSWWTDSYSLNYIKDKYGITGSLGVSDQFLADGYQIWGQPWSTPFYPNKFHPAVPASNEITKINVVNFQWASREPREGYKNSFYSTQDYSVIGLNFEFFKKLVDIYAKKHSNDFGQITIGLEGDLSPEAYQGEFKKQVEYAKDLQDSEEFEVTNMAEFSNWYRQKFRDLSPVYKTESENVIWYQSPEYRVGVEFENKDKAKIFDLRSYNQTLVDPYGISPNRLFKLSIYLPSIFDEVQNPESVWELNAKKENIEFLDDRIIIKNIFLANVPKELSKSKQVKIERSLGRLEIIFLSNKNSINKSILIKDWSAESVHFFKRKRAILDLFMRKGWSYLKKMTYEIPHGEINALEKLSTLPSGKVMVYDNECLQCSWHTEFKPPAFSNRRKYVENFGKHSIKYNSSIFEATEREKAKRELNKLNVKYVYLVKFEDYVEKLPFSPGDLGVEKIYDNANTEIWRVIK